MSSRSCLKLHFIFFIDLIPPVYMCPFNKAKLHLSGNGKPISINHLIQITLFPLESSVPLPLAICTSQSSPDLPNKSCSIYYSLRPILLVFLSFCLSIFDHSSYSKKIEIIIYFVYHLLYYQKYFTYDLFFLYLH